MKQKGEKAISGQYKEDLTQVGKALRHARNKAGMSVRDLHFESGIYPYMISNIENGKQGTRIATLSKLFECLGVTMSQAFSDLAIYQQG